MNVNNPVSVIGEGNQVQNKVRISKNSKISIAIGTVVIITVIGILIAAFGNSGSSAKHWACDYCGKTWTGVAYHNDDFDATLCAECAWDYWEPFPIDNYRKR